MKIKTADLTGPALDWAAAISLGWKDVRITDYADPDLPNECFFRPAKVVEGVTVCGSGCLWMPDRDWSQGGPIIEREGIGLDFYEDGGHEHGGEWGAATNEGTVHALGRTPLIAAMRCFVASRLGDEVDIPDEFL